MKLSIVSPVYLGEMFLEELVNRLIESVSTLCESYEIILVEDGSPDKSWEIIKKICESNKEVKGVKLSRNFGQHYAITAGLETASGDWIVVMDCDLQDVPEEIPRLFAKAQEGYDIIFARREIRQDNFVKKLSSKVFFTVFQYLTNAKQDASIANFGIYHKKVIAAFLAMKDHIRCFPIMLQWVGFSSAKLNVKHCSRKDGKSAYSWVSLLKFAFDNIIAFSDKLLKITVKLGFTISIISFCVGLYYLYKYVTGKIEVLGFTSLIISIWFLSGIIILILGVMGIYLGKIFDKVKDRPTFIIDEKRNLSN